MAKKSEKKEVALSLVSRINRISGQVTAVQKMIKKEEDYDKILLQLKAARSAIKSLETAMLEEHLSSCLSSITPKNQAKKVTELTKILKNLCA